MKVFGNSKIRLMLVITLINFFVISLVALSPLGVKYAKGISKSMRILGFSEPLQISHVNPGRHYQVSFETEQALEKCYDGNDILRCMYKLMNTQAPPKFEDNEWQWQYDRFHVATSLLSELQIGTDELLKIHLGFTFNEVKEVRYESARKILSTLMSVPYYRGEYTPNVGFQNPPELINRVTALNFALKFLNTNELPYSKVNVTTEYLRSELIKAVRVQLEKPIVTGMGPIDHFFEGQIEVALSKYEITAAELQGHMTK